ncbi:molecular chaperone [Parasphingorhabdus sp.]|jgi:P pilus assembly chaperone PapD|uniref:fimbrial biogenesis chaperone n=1 Tax=Parasphingorhabdus sp. TaxID=2709688 RepID=UPI003BB04CD7
MKTSGLRRFNKFYAGLAIIGSALFLSNMPAHAAGDLLVAPTRIVLDGQRGTEVILNNIGSETATYRISLELRRMTAEGKLKDVSAEEANQVELAAKEMIRYAPRRVTLPPNQPQAIRLGIRPPQDLPDGEYRAHLLFRAIPKAKAVTEQESPSGGFTIALTPIYGVTIPVIIRQGNLQATAGIANARVETSDNGQAFAFDLSRTGDRSTYGEIRVLKQGESEPILVARGIAIYPEVERRKVTLPVPADIAAKLKGAISVEYYEPDNAGGGLITKSQMVLR